MVHSPLWFIVSRDETNQRCAKSFQSSNGFRCCDVRSYTARLLLFPVKHHGNRTSRAPLFLYDCARWSLLLFRALRRSSRPFAIRTKGTARFDFKRGTNKFLIHFSLTCCVEDSKKSEKVYGNHKLFIVDIILRKLLFIVNGFVINKNDCMY